MTSDVVPFQPPAPTGNTLEIAGEAWKIASKLANTEFVPKGMRGSPETVLACILTGHEAGISPMQALAKIHMVQGRPAMAAELMRALVLRAGHEVWVEESTSTKVTVKGCRSGSERVSSVTWTMDDAVRAKLTGKDNWKHYPRAMMLARASTELCRQLFPDVLAGISHSMEELADGGDIEPEIIPATAGAPEQHADTAPETMQANATAAPPSKKDEPAKMSEPPRAEAPPLPGEEDDESDIIDAEVIDDSSDVEEPEPVPVSAPAETVAEPEVPPLDDEAWPQDPDPQIGEPETTGTGPTMSGPQMIAMRFGDIGITKRDDKLAAVAALVDHDVDSANDLTSDEISMVLAWIEANQDVTSLDDVVSRVMAADDAPETQETGTQRRTAVSDVADWDKDRWVTFVKAQKLTIPKAIRIAQGVGAEQDPVVKIATMDDLAGSSIGDEVAARMTEAKK